MKKYDLDSNRFNMLIKLSQKDQFLNHYDFNLQIIKMKFLKKLKLKLIKVIDGGFTNTILNENNFILLDHFNDRNAFYNYKKKSIKFTLQCRRMFRIFTTSLFNEKKYPLVLNQEI